MQLNKWENNKTTTTEVKITIKELKMYLIVPGIKLRFSMFLFYFNLESGRNKRNSRQLLCAINFNISKN